jgi:DNA-binding CsgD family transcriptional regulator
VSVRTVESHLQRAYEKLGISGRDELTAALRDQPGP